MVSLYSTIKMMHGPSNIKYGMSADQSTTAVFVSSYQPVITGILIAMVTNVTIRRFVTLVSRSPR